MAIWGSYVRFQGRKPFFATGIPDRGSSKGYVIVPSKVSKSCEPRIFSSGRILSTKNLLSNMDPYAMVYEIIFTPDPTPNHHPKVRTGFSSVVLLMLQKSGEQQLGSLSHSLRGF